MLNTTVILKHTYHKNERLKSRKIIQELFSKGVSFTQFPLKVLFLPIEVTEQQRLRAGVSVGTKRFKKAVDRNRIKRLIRESYRRQKHGLTEVLEAKKMGLAIFFIYTGVEIPLYSDLYLKTGKLLDRLLAYCMLQNTTA